MEILTEEIYYYDTQAEAEAAARLMQAERACDMQFEFNAQDGRVQMTVKVGKVRG